MSRQHSPIPTQLHFEGHFTSDVPREVREALRIDCLEYLDLSVAGRLVFRSTDPPSIIQVVASVSTWAVVFKLVAVAFMTQLAKNAADDFWKNKSQVATVLKRKSIAPLQHVSTAVAKALRRSPEKTRLELTIELSAHHQAKLVLSSVDRESIAIAIALIAIHAEQLSVFIARESASERGVTGDPVLEIADDGSIIVKWSDRVDIKRHKKTLR